LLANAAIDLLAAFQRGGETLAGLPDFFARYVGGGGHQVARIFGERGHLIIECFCLVCHMGLSFFILWVSSRGLCPPLGSLRFFQLRLDSPWPAVALSCPRAWPAFAVVRRVCPPSVRLVVYSPQDDCRQAWPRIW